MAKNITKILLAAVASLAAVSAFAQGPRPGYKEKTVYKGPDLEIRQIDEHTWHATATRWPTRLSISLKVRSVQS